MIDKIDLQKTRLTGRLHFLTSGFDKALRLSISLFFILLFPILITTDLIQNPDSLQNDLFGQVMSIIVCYGFGAFMTIVFVNSKSMTRIHKKDIAKERDKILSTIAELGWELATNNGDYIIAMSAYNKQLTIVMDYDSFLVSSIRFGRSDVTWTKHTANLDLFIAKYYAITAANKGFKL